jgi:hypothetical protein
MGEADFAALVADIKANGQRLPIVVYEDQVLDGWHRYRACQQLGITPKTHEWCPLHAGADPVAFVLSLNLQRRHLTESQRAMVAAELATLERGGDRRSPKFKGSPDPLKKKASSSSIEAAAKKLDVSPASVKRAKTVLKHGTPGLVNDVKTGKVPVKTAARQAKAAARGSASTPTPSSKPPPAPAPSVAPGAANPIPLVTTQAILDGTKITNQRFFRWRRDVKEIVALIEKHPSLRAEALAWLGAVADALKRA